MLEKRTSRWRIRHLQRLQAIQKAWPKAAGRYVAGNVWPVRLVRKTLRCATEDSVWVQEMNYLKDSILERLQKLLPGRWVDDLKVVVCELPPEAGLPEEQNRGDLPPPSAEMIDAVEKAKGKIGNPELAEAFGRAMLSYLRLDAARRGGVESRGNSREGAEK